MADPVRELQKIKGIGPVTAQRLVGAGLDSYVAIVEAGENGLRGVRGINPASIPAIIEQAGAIASAQGPEPSPPADPVSGLKAQVQELRVAIQEIASAARDRFPGELSGTAGRKLTRNMVRSLDALYAIEELLDTRPKRSRKALDKSRRNIEGLTGCVDVNAIRKRIRKTRKALEQVLD